MNDITEKLLEIVSDWDGKFKGAYNIRENSGCAGRQSSENIRIESKTDQPRNQHFYQLQGTAGDCLYPCLCYSRRS